MIQFIEMGGYGAFVWPAYGLAALVLVGLLLATLRGLRAKEAEWAAIDLRAAPARAAARVARGR
jgi:heme exporter protein D